MKNCKFCNAELPEGVSVCPACGKDNQQTLSGGKTVLAIAAVVAVVILAVGVLLGMRIGGKQPEEDVVPAVSE